MSGTAIVYITARQLTLTAPRSDGLRYHRSNRRRWERTACGIIHEWSGQRVTVGLREDTAELIADPCRICYGWTDRPAPQYTEDDPDWSAMVSPISEDGGHDDR
jgi:hypothetical protein